MSDAMRRLEFSTPEKARKVELTDDMLWGAIDAEISGVLTPEKALEAPPCLGSPADSMTGQQQGQQEQQHHQQQRMPMLQKLQSFARASHERGVTAPQVPVPQLMPTSIPEL